jgi:hypothetical protein
MKRTCINDFEPAQLRSITAWHAGSLMNSLFSASSASSSESSESLA